MRSALVTALLACSNHTLTKKTKARRFLEGLSSDELQFIAEYLGSRILETTAPVDLSSGRASTEFKNHCSCSSIPDREHKMILLVEYLRRSGNASAGPA